MVSRGNPGSCGFSLGKETLYRKPRTSIPARGASIRPYLLTGLAITRPNQVWAADLTYLPMAHGFQYLVAILDVYSRKVLSWRVSNTMTRDFCVEALQEALERHGKPEIFNTDQGSQFTGGDWTDVLEAEAIQISMDGKGLREYFEFYNVERSHQSLDYRTPDDVYYGRATLKLAA